MKVLVLEDELIVGLDLVMLLGEWGHIASGPHVTPQDAIEAISTFKPDLALLDLNLGKFGNSHAVAVMLKEMGIPFAYLTGYGSARSSDAGALEGVLILNKPFIEAELKSFLDSHDASAI